MMECSPVYLFNRYCNFPTCLNERCQLPEVTSVFWLSLLPNVFPSRILVWSCYAETSLSFPIQFDELRVVFYGEKLRECCHGLLLFCMNTVVVRVLWCQFIPVLSSTCRLFFWSSVIFIQLLEPSQNPRSSQFFFVLKFENIVCILFKRLNEQVVHGSKCAKSAARCINSAGHCDQLWFFSVRLIGR